MQRDALLAVDRVRAPAGAAAAGWSAAAWQASWPHRCLYGQQGRWRCRRLKPGMAEPVGLQLPPPQVELLERHAYPQRPLDRSQGALFASPWPLGLQRPLLSIKRPWPPPPRLCALVLSPPGTQATQPGQEWRWCTVTRCQPYHAQRRHGSHATVHPGGAVSSAWNPQVLCEPSQNGFLAECPQRHRA